MTTDSATDLPVMPVLRQRLLDPPLEYDQFREDAPVARVRFPSGLEGWLVTRFDDVSAVFSDPRFSARRVSHDRQPDEPSAYEGGDGEQAQPGADPTFVFMDPPEHGPYRRLLTGRFTPKSVRERLQPYIDQVVKEHLDAIEAAPKPVDLVEMLALPIPCLVICELLGVPYADRDGFHEATIALMDTQATPDERNAGALWLQTYIAQLVFAKKADPTSTGLLAELIRDQETGGWVTDADLISIGVLLLFAGHDTTMAMLSLSILTLLTHDQQRQELVEHPEKIGAATEELLRYLSIVQFGLGRTAKEDLELGGQQIAAGDTVILSMAAANRDPRAFENPDDTDFDRTMTRHLAFGFGVHQCLGQNVARAELVTVLPQLFARFPGLRLATPVEEVPMDVYGNNYGVKELLVTW